VKIFKLFLALGTMMVLSTGALQLSSAVWQEEQLSQSTLISVQDRLDADKNLDETRVSSNATLGQPGLALIALGLLGLAITRRKPRQKSPEFPGRADWTLFDRLRKETDAYFVGNGISNP